MFLLFRYSKNEKIYQLAHKRTKEKLIRLLNPLNNFFASYSNVCTIFHEISPLKLLRVTNSSIFPPSFFAGLFYNPIIFYSREQRPKATDSENDFFGHFTFERGSFIKW